MNRRETLVLLLEWYPDVLEGVRDMGGVASDDERLPLMCRAWNHSSYKQLERLRLRLRHDEPSVYWHVAERFLRAETRRVLECPACRREVAPESSRFASDGSVKTMHKHKGRAVVLVPRSVRRWSPAVRPEMVDQGLAWLEGRWRGHGPFLPDDIRTAAGLQARVPDAA